MYVSICVAYIDTQTTIVWLSHLTRIIWSNHLEDYVFIITYLSKLHSHFSELQYPYGNFFHFVFFFFFILFLSLSLAHKIRFIHKHTNKWFALQRSKQSVMLLPVLKLWLLLLR